MKTRVILDVRTPLLHAASDKPVVQMNYYLAMKTAQWLLPGVTVITDELRKDLQPVFGKTKPVAIWTSGVDADMFSPSYVQPIYRDTLGLQDRFVFFYHGSISVSRGVLVLIQAMRLLHAAYPASTLILLGDGPGKRPLQRHVSESGLDDVVFFLDTVPNDVVPQYIAMADVGVIPLPDDRCWQVSSPLKLFEYMAMQLPLVVSDIIAHHSVLGDEPSFALYADVETPEKLSHTLRRAVENIAELKERSWEAREQVLSKHTWRTQAEVLHHFLNRWLAG
jgi:glycosyltransferase involved in cell wall biosynthesis